MSDRVGQQFGKYQLLRLLGEGTTSHVYLGKQHGEGKEVAVKVLNTQVAPERAAALLAEGQKMVQLNHPNIRRTLDLGVERQTPYLVLDYAPKDTLRKRHLSGEKLAPALILPYVRQIAEALHYAHRQRMIHADVRPENLLLGENNQILVNDFSFSFLLLAFNLKKSQLRSPVNYIAPEHYDGRPRAASDQYSLAVVIYEWLCGEQPFQGSEVQIASALVSSAPPPLRQKNPAISEAIENVILTALSKDWRDRYASIQAFAKAFERACQSGSFLTATADEIVSIPPTDVQHEAEQPSSGNGTDATLEPDQPASAEPIIRKPPTETISLSPSRTTTFISYSHADKLYLDEFHVHLKFLEKTGGFDFWDDTRLLGGDLWREEIRRAIGSARIAILLVSPNFLASEFITTEELPPLLLAAKKEGATILPVIVRDSLFHISSLSEFQAFKGISRPLTRPLSEMQRHERDKFWVEFATFLKGLIS